MGRRARGLGGVSGPSGNRWKMILEYNVRKRVCPASRQGADCLPLTRTTTRGPGTHARHGRTGGRVGPHESGGNRVARATASRLPSSARSRSFYFLAAIFGAISCADEDFDRSSIRTHTRVEREDLMVDVGGSRGSVEDCIRRPWMYIRRPKEV